MISWFQSLLSQLGQLVPPYAAVLSTDVINFVRNGGKLDGDEDGTNEAGALYKLPESSCPIALESAW